jgi:hypothetical protein
VDKEFENFKPRGHQHQIYISRNLQMFTEVVENEAVTKKKEKKKKGEWGALWYCRL